MTTSGSTIIYVLYTRLFLGPEWKYRTRGGDWAASLYYTYRNFDI